MQPSSLVFLAIVAMWAAYLLPQWIRRRDTLAQSRGRDRHSDRLRVLRPRRRRVRGGRSSAPLLRPQDAGAARAGRVEGRAARGAAGGGRGSHEGARAAAVAASAQTRSVHAGRVAARRRGRVLLALLSLTSVSWLFAVATVVPAWVALPSTALLGLDLAALRAVAVREAARRRRTADADRAVARARGATGGRAAGDRARPTAPRRTGHPAPTAASARAAAAAAARRREAAAAAAAPGGQAGELLAADGTWEPVPVPPPTYTLKPAAPRPEPPALDLFDQDRQEPLHDAPAGTSDARPSGAEGVPDGPAERSSRRPWEDGHEWADGLDLDAVLARRRAVNG